MARRKPINKKIKRNTIRVNYKTNYKPKTFPAYNNNFFNGLPIGEILQNIYNISENFQVIQFIVYLRIPQRGILLATLRIRMPK